MSRYLCNKIRCPVCEEVIQSYHRYDFKFCKCGSVAVDGGNDYLRRVSEVVWEELSVLDDGTHETRRNNLVWGNQLDKKGKILAKNKINWILIKNIETSHIENIIKGNHTNDPLYLEVFNNELEYRSNL